MSIAIKLEDVFVPVMCKLGSGSALDLAQIDIECNVPPWNESLFLKEFDNSVSQVYGVRARGELIGFLVAHAVVDEAHILNFGVRKEYRGAGVGRGLLLFSLKELSRLGVRWATLEVRVTNKIAQKLYGSVGFFEIGRRERYYTDNQEDALVLGINMRQFLAAQSTVLD